MKRWGWIAISLAVALLAALAAWIFRIEPAPDRDLSIPPALGPVERTPGPEAKNMIVVAGPAGQRVSGSALDDKLMDKTGGSVLIGLGGNDTYQAPDEKTRVIERPGQGLDTIETWNSFKIPANIENLVLVGQYSTGTAAPGGSLLTSKGLGNVLESGPGSDTLVAAREAKQTTFLFHPGSGVDAVLNFTATGDPHDYIRLTWPNLCDYGAIRRKMTASGANDTLLTLSPRDRILIKGVRPDVLGPGHFLLCFSPKGMELAFEEQFDTLSLHDRASGIGRWKTAFAHGPADGPQSADARRLAGNHDQQVYVDPSYAGNPRVSSAPLGLDPFSTANGILSIRAWRLPPAVRAKLWGIQFASGLLTSESSFTQTYGYYEVRADLPQIKGMFPAFWLLPTSRKWPPEIDIMENVAQDFATCGLITDDKRLAFFIRFHGGVKGMHRYGVLWTPHRISWVFDGQVVGSTATPASLHQPMYMLLNLAVGGKWPGSPHANFRSAEMKVDYIRVYRWKPPA